MLHYTYCNYTLIYWMFTVPDREVGHLSWDRDFCELKQQIQGVYGLVWQTSILQGWCTTVAILEHVVLCGEYFCWWTTKWGKTQKWATGGNLHCRLTPPLQIAILNYWDYYCTSSFESGDILVWKWIIIWCLKCTMGKWPIFWSAICGLAWISPQTQIFSVMLYPTFQSNKNLCLLSLLWVLNTNLFSG